MVFLEAIQPLNAEAQDLDLVPGWCPWFGLQEIHDVNLWKKWRGRMVKGVGFDFS